MTAYTQPQRINKINRIPPDICIKAQLPAVEADGVGLGVTADAWVVSPMVIVVQAGLVVIELAWEPGVVGEGGRQAGGVGVGLADPERVGIVPAPVHLVVGGPCKLLFDCLTVWPTDKLGQSINLSSNRPRQNTVYCVFWLYWA